MISNDERREIAARLREQRVWDIFTNFENCIGDLCDAVFDDEGDLNDMFSLQKALADLIEPEPYRTTTRNGKFKKKYGNRVPLCECCGYSIGDKRYNYCPNCGAKVVEQ